jgi:hypothetical protein
MGERRKINPFSRVLLEKLIVAQIVNKLHGFYGTKKVH